MNDSKLGKTHHPQVDGRTGTGPQGPKYHSPKYDRVEVVQYGSSASHHNRGPGTGPKKHEESKKRAHPAHRLNEIDRHLSQSIPGTGDRGLGKDLATLPVDSLCSPSSPPVDGQRSQPTAGVGIDHAALLAQHKAEQSQLRSSQYVPDTGWSTGQGSRLDPSITRPGNAVPAVRALKRQRQSALGYQPTLVERREDINAVLEIQEASPDVDSPMETSAWSKKGYAEELDLGDSSER